MTKEYLRTIPPRTMRDVWREKQAGVSFQKTTGESPKGSDFEPRYHVFEKPINRKPHNTLVTPESTKITWMIEIQDDYNGQGDLGLIAQFSGISFTDTTVFERSKADYGPDSCVYYCRIDYNKGPAFLVLATTEDIFESQVVARRKDKNPLFIAETLITQLTNVYDPNSMRVNYNNGFVIVGYQVYTARK